MELKIIEKKEKPLLLRTEITTEILFEGKIPSREEIKKEIVKEIKTNENLVIIKKIRTYFGLRKAKVKAYVYGSEADIKKIEPKEKGKKEDKEKAEEPKKEAPQKEESKKEEKEEGKKPKEGKKEKTEEKETKDKKKEEKSAPST